MITGIKNQFFKIFVFAILFLSPQIILQNKFNYPYPWPKDLLNSQSEFSDVTGLLLGTHRLSADLAWIQTLQYYGSHEEDEDNENADHDHHHLEGGEYPDLLGYCQRVVKLDPYFRYAYLYGGASLAWNLHRYDEAIQLLNEGIKHNPNYWRFSLYLAAIGYTQKDEYNKVIPLLLENLITYPDCPLMVKAILANIYEKNQQYLKEYNLWLKITQEDKEEEYLSRSTRRLSELKKLLTKAANNK